MSVWPRAEVGCLPYVSMMSDTARRVLLKLGQLRWMHAFAAQGTILMRPLAYYTELENKAQGDPDEGLVRRYSALNPTLNVTAKLPRGINIPLPGASMKIYSRARKHGVYSMYGIPTEEEHGQTNDRVFGEIAADPNIALFDYDGLVLIRNANEFDDRLKAAALRLGFILDLGLVRYVPPSHCGDMGPFTKLDSYAYQNEVRYLTTRPIPKEGLKLNLGPLEDIVAVFDVRRELVPRLKSNNRQAFSTLPV